MNQKVHNQIVSFIWSIADDVLRDVFVRGKYRDIILPFTVLRRLDALLVPTKEKVLEALEAFKKLNHYNNLRVFGVHEKGDMDYDKNQISLGMDVLIGTPIRVNEMFSSAGFNMNTIKMFVVDDVEEMLRKREDSIIQRLSMSAEKTQRLFFCSQITERVEILADRIMIEPLFFEMED